VAAALLTGVPDENAPAPGCAHAQPRYRKTSPGRNQPAHAHGRIIFQVAACFRSSRRHAAIAATDESLRANPARQFTIEVTVNL
jgi:hypothetical protein